MSIEIQHAVSLEGIPPDHELVRFAELALPPGGALGICLRIVDEAESRALNHEWRGKDAPTNVLSFPSSPPPGLPASAAGDGLCGDLALCAPVIAREAQVQGKPLLHHWAHLVIHGILHLRGFDHIQDEQAAEMEQLERELLAGIGIADPYADG
jgi:probable rRNA maturation factor